MTELANDEILPTLGAYHQQIYRLTLLVSSCSATSSTDDTDSGNGLIHLRQKTFCANVFSNNDNCNDLNVCKTVNDLREEKFYLPLDRTENISQEKYLKIRVVSIDLFDS